MRPRKLRRVIAASSAALVLAGTGVGACARPAIADTATMSGTLGIAPNYAPLCPCVTLRHSVMPTQAGLADMVAAIDRWAATPAPTASHSEPKRNVSFSASTQGATGWVRDHRTDPAARVIEFVAMGSSETPGNGWAGTGHKRTEGLPTDQGAVFGNFTFVVRQYDPISDKASNPNFWSRINEKLSTHTEGYDGIDLDAPDATWTDPVTGSTTKYFRSDVLPMLRWRQGFTSDERMAELDAKYRPRIEKAYDRPVDLEDPDVGDSAESDASEDTSDRRSVDRDSASRDGGAGADSDRRDDGVADDHGSESVGADSEATK